jgi:hypothetical protein
VSQAELFLVKIKKGGKQMKKILRLATLFVVCLMLFSISTNNLQADGPAPVGVPAEGSDALPSDVTVALEGAFTTGNDVLPSDVTVAPEGASTEGNDVLPSDVTVAPVGVPTKGNDALPRELEAPSQLSVEVPQSEPSASDGESSTSAELDAMAGSVTVSSVWTTDGNSNSKSTFNCGDSIRYYGDIYNNTGSSKTAYFSWSVTGPCGSIASWSGNLTTGAGTYRWYLSGSIPSNACAGTYTYKLSVTYGGSTSSKSTNFTVNCGGGSVTVSSVWTTDGNGNSKSTFNCGDSIRYYGDIYNNTGSSKTAYFSWSVTGPCGSIASWSGNLTTGAGTYRWYLSGSIPSNACAGTYTYKLSVTYGGSTSSKSTTFTVNCGGGSVTVSSVWTTDGSGNSKSTFNCGDSIRYYGDIYNNTGSSQTAYFSWSVTGPCGSIASWSGNLTTGSGTYRWYLSGSIPSNACAGTYTYKLSVTYGGSTSSKSTTFTGGGWKLPFEGPWIWSGGPHVYKEDKASCNNMVAGDPSGIDFATDRERAVLAVDSGTVVGAGSKLDGFNGYGVQIQHGQYVIGYMHLKGDITWTSGQTVQQGTQIGTTWSEENYHVHLELKQSGQRVSWDGKVIDGYTVHVIRRATNTSQIWNYEGTMTKGTTWTDENRTTCGNWGNGIWTLANEIVYHWGSITSSNQKR